MSIKSQTINLFNLSEPSSHVHDIGNSSPPSIFISKILFYGILCITKAQILYKSIGIQVAVGIRACPIPLPGNAVVFPGLMSVPAAQASVTLIAKFLLKSIVCKEPIKKAACNLSRMTASAVRRGKITNGTSVLGDPQATMRHLHAFSLLLLAYQSLFLFLMKSISHPPGKQRCMCRSTLLT